MSDWPDWPPAARALIERACDRYGGHERWLRRELVLTPRVLSGLLPAFKGFGSTFAFPRRIRVIPSLDHVVFEDYPALGGQGIYDAGVVTLVGADQREQLRVPALRASFHGLHKLARWQPLDALYFFGYALAHYHAVPFTLGQARFLRQSRRRDLDALTVEFPVEVHTHSRQQTFYFDREGLIRRHDYVADIVGWWARGAHFWRDYTAVDGFPIARCRHVVSRLGLPFTALHAEFAQVDCHDRVARAPTNGT